MYILLLKYCNIRYVFFILCGNKDYYYYYILYQLICRGKTTGLSSEPARRSCDNFDSCQSNRTHTDGLHN